MEDIPTGLTFDDVLLVPNYSEVLPGEVDPTGLFTRNIVLRSPVVSAAMDTVTESAMAITLGTMGGLGVIHKNLSIEKQSAEVALVKKRGVVVAAAVGATGDFFERATALVSAGVDVIVVDTAHGHSMRVIDAVKIIKKKLRVPVVAGNIATYEAAQALMAAGADALKVGIGPGSICTTRIMSGCGVPQMYAIQQEVVRAARRRKIPVIADGGITYSGDIVKALAAGASCVMIGSLLGGTDEAPGNIFEESGKKFKHYRGMGSLGAMNDGSKDRYGLEAAGAKLVPEGVEARVPYRGTVAPLIEQLIGGLRSGMGYCGARTIPELQKRARFIRISPAGLRESHVHDVQGVKNAPNYQIE